MIVLIVLSCLCYVGSAIPLSAKPAPPLESHLSPRVHGAAEATEAQTPAPLAPIEQPQPSSQPLPSPQLLPPLQQYPWSPLGGAPMIFPYQPGVVGSQPAANQPGMPIQPLVFPPFGYMPLFPPYTNQMLSPYRLPEAPLPQAPANPAPNVLPAETSLTAAPGGEVLQTQQQQQQQQTPQVIYMMQQPMNPQLGGLSSEELQIAAKLSQMGMFTVMNNAAGGPLQQVIPAAGIPNQVNAEVGVLPAGVQKIQGPNRRTGGSPCSKKQQTTGPQKAAAEPAAADID
ncbi:hypothetical protein NL108_009909 [Boleophthalmus pectinirostris]|uniref:uncharacterized protein LOC110165424 n=1 Tax=Boleophthalmus pectinirostris TaxID=150288 RepID=UPI000A1C286D|nr:uncharacterized protein LOC110165424 [Boleophthalmus pectinirostris]KAJ0050918.1 hypothetical protein NL108_009909 [Boleophthalmus pectinirostris]